MREPHATLFESLLLATLHPGVVVLHGPRGLGKSHLAERLAAQREITVLDDVEDVDAVLDEALFRRARNERIVITTRTRPRAQRVHAVAALPWAVPQIGTSADELAEHPTVAFFLEHAGRKADRSERRAVATILRRLEGVPELVVRAAERAGRLGVAAVRELLEASIDTSSWYAERASPSDPDGYPAFVRARLMALGPGRTLAARAAALFPGGFDVHAILAVARQDKASVIYALEELLEHGLLVALDHERFVMLRPEREIVRQVLGEDAAQRRRLVATLVAETEGGPTIDASPRALQLRPNVEAALRQASSMQDARSTVALTRWLGRLYLAAGPAKQFGLLASRLVAQFEQGDLRDADAHAEALWLRGLARVASGMYGEAAADFAAAARSTVPTVRALSLSKRGLLRGLGGDFAAAAESMREAGAVAAAHGVPPYVLGELAKDEANVLAEQGSELVYERMLRARAIFRAAGYAREEAFMLLMLAGRTGDRGDLITARQLCKRSLALFEKVGDRRSPAWLFCVSGLIEQEAGKVHRAANRLRRARRLARAYGDDFTAALATGFLAGLHLEHGELEPALELYASATEALGRFGHEGWLAYFAAGAAAAQAELGRLDVAAEGSAHGLATSAGRSARRVAMEILACALAVPKATTLGAVQTLARTVRAQVAGLSSEESRWAARVLERQLAARHAALVQLAPPSLRVAADASWFEVDGQRVELGRRRVLHRLFARLVDAEPGARVATLDLVRHVWSGEHVSASAASNRLYVAIARLRTEGLSDVLLQEGDGYFLACVVQRDG